MLTMILSFFTTLLIHLLFAGGLIIFIAGTFLGMVPFISKYRLPVQVIGGILLCGGIYLEGTLAGKESMYKDVAQLETKLAQAQIAAGQKNTEIVTKLTQKTQIIHDKGADIIHYIQNDAAQINSSCTLPPEVVEVHNKAAQITADSPTNGSGK